MATLEVQKSPLAPEQPRMARPPNGLGLPSLDKKGPLDPEQLRKINAYWRAANYLSVGQIYLCGNPLLREPLKLEHVKQLLLGHWGTTPGQNFIYAHLNRIIKQHDLDMMSSSVSTPRIVSRKRRSRWLRMPTRSPCSRTGR